MKMKKIKAIIYIALSVATITAFNANVFARDQINAIIGNPEILRERTVDDGSDPLGAWPVEMKNEAEVRAAVEARLAAAPKNPIQSRTGWLYIPYDVYKIHQQETKVWCGPAVIESVLTVLNGSAPSQSTIYNGVKYTDGQVYLDDMTRYVNARLRNHEYTFNFSTGTSRTTMQNSIYTGIVSDGQPTMIGLTFSKGGPWKYNTNGHFVTVYGVTSDKASYMLGDPYIAKWVGEPKPYYSVSGSYLYKAFSAQNLGISF